MRYDVGERNEPRAVAVPKVLRAVVHAALESAAHHVVLLTASFSSRFVRLNVSSRTPIDRRCMNWYEASKLPSTDHAMPGIRFDPSG